MPEIAESFYAPNSFSPNNDGINDEFEIAYNPEVLPSSLQIYDRWGGLRFEQRQGDALRWDGRSNHDGHLMESGVYVYVLHYQNRRTAETKQKSGDVTLWR